MNPLQVICEKSIPNKSGSKYKGIAFDGCYLYLTCPDICEIMKYDSCFCEVECFKTLKPYSCICYDNRENCFWTTSSKYYCKLFKLDINFNEIDCISINDNENGGGTIEGISYDFKTNCLIIAFENSIVSVNTANCQREELTKKTYTITNTGVLSISPNIIIVEMQNSKQYASIYDCDFKMILKFDIPSLYFIEAIIFNPCIPQCDGKYHFYILTTKNGCYPYILEWTIDCCDLEICQCNFFVCEKDCCDSFYPPRTCSHNDLIESIALIETSLAHILNAEGEKLQKIISSTDDFEKILCVNEAISETIVKITHLEIVLHDKLAAIISYHNYCDEC